MQRVSGVARRGPPAPQRMVAFPSRLSEHELVTNVMMTLGFRGPDSPMAQQTARAHPGRACPVSRKPVSSNGGAGFLFSVPACDLEKNTFSWHNPARCVSVPRLWMAFSLPLSLALACCRVSTRVFQIFSFRNSP